MDELDEILTGVGITPNPQNRQALRDIMRRRAPIDTAGRLSAGGNRGQELLNLKIEEYRKAGIVTSQSLLRAETPLLGAVNSIPFNFLAAGKQTNQGENIPTVRLLDQNDSFTVTGICFYIKRAARAANQNPTDAQHAIAPLYTFANPQIFSAANEAANLQALYNGTVQIKLDVTVFNPQYPVLAHYRVPQAQQGVGTATGVTGVQRDEWPLPLYGKVDSKPSFEFGGQTQLTVVEDINGSVDLSANSTTARNYAVLMFTGLLHSGANAEFQARQKRAQKMG